MTAGAYNAVQPGIDHTRRRVPEVPVRGDQAAIVRPRPSYHELIGLDRVLEWLA